MIIHAPIRTLALIMLAVALPACGSDDDDDHRRRATVSRPDQLATDARLKPERVGRDYDWASAAVGAQYQTCVRKKAGSLWCAGENDVLQLGVEEPGRSGTLLRIGEDFWTEVRLGKNPLAPAACGVTRGGRLYCWGSPFATSEEAAVTGRLPTELGSGWATVSVGYTHACAVAESGALACWGTNLHGELGLGSVGDSRAKPTTVSAAGWKAVAAGETHTCAVKTDGSLWCWGAGAFTGSDASGNVSKPRQVSSSTTWESVSAGGRHTCGVRSPGSIWCWGEGTFGQLGVAASSEPWTIPVQAGAATDWAQVSAGTSHTCAVKLAGGLFCWGGNEQGQLGSGSRFVTSKPTQVSGSGSWAQVDAGYAATCGVRTDGSLWCWGKLPIELTQQ